MNNLYSKLDDKTIQAFAGLMVEKMESLTVSWKQPWINPKSKGWPQNLSGRKYSLSNALFLYMLCEVRHFEIPVFLTFLQAKENNLLINKGAKAFPVIYFDFKVKHRHKDEKISFDEYNQLTTEEQADYQVIPFPTKHLVFNVEQTNIKEVRPELWNKLFDKFSVDIPLDTKGMVTCKPLDMLVEQQKWECPIYPEEGNAAFYRPDEIHIPLKSQFNVGETYYTTLLHEMTHSTGAQGRLNRPLINHPGSEAYGREELIAELTAALVAASMGIATIPLEDSVAYLKGWCKNMKKDPNYIFTILSEVGKAAAMITSVTDKLELAIDLETEKKETRQPLKVYTSGKGEQLEFCFAEPSPHEELGAMLLGRHLKNLQEGEFCKVERIFEESGSFSFTSGEKVETLEDVAYIFRRLEDASIENSFAVLVKNGTPVVLHLGMGVYTSTAVNTSAIKVAADRLNPDAVYFVHNHPSGRVKASTNDILLWTSLKKIIGDKLMPGIIINLRSGHFGLFTETILPKKELSNENKKEIPLKLYSFSKQVYRHNYNPEENSIIRNSSDIASMVSSQRLGDRKKINALILDNGSSVVANIFTPFTALKKEKIDEMAKSLISSIAITGGTSAIIYGDFQIDKIQQELARKVKEYSMGQFILLDTIAIKGNNSFYLSAADEGILREDKVSYSTLNDIDQRNSNFSTNHINMEQNIKTVDLAKVSWEAIKTKLGITKEVLVEKGVLDDMLYFRKSSQLFTIRYEGATGTKEFDARLQFRLNKDEYDLKFYPVKQAPELDKPYLGYTFTEEDKKNLLQTGHLGKIVSIQPYNSDKRDAFISLDPLTNDIVHIDRDKVSFKSTICGVTLTDDQKNSLMQGKPVQINGMTNTKGNKFSSFIQVDANKKGLSLIFPEKNKVDINTLTEILGAKISDKQREDLKNGQSIFLDNLKAKDGRIFSSNISFDAENQKLKYDFPDKHKLILTEEQQKAIDNGEKVILTGLISQKGKPYDIVVFKNKETRGLEREFPVKASAFGVLLSPEQKKELQNGKYVWISNLQKKDGTTFKAPLIWNAKEGKFGFADLKKKETITPTLPNPSPIKEKKGRKI